MRSDQVIDTFVLDMRHSIMGFGASVRDVQNLLTPEILALHREYMVGSDRILCVERHLMPLLYQPVDGIIHIPEAIKLVSVCSNPCMLRPFSKWL